MSNTHSSESELGQPSREEMMSAIFANLVVQQTNMALMLMGRVAHPETGERVQDLEAARMFIDQLEMIELKTKGNLDKREEQLLKQSLMSLRMAFVETVESGPGQTATAAAPNATPQPPVDHDVKTGETAASATPEEESRKKFTKKY